MRLSLLILNKSHCYLVAVKVRESVIFSVLNGRISMKVVHFVTI